MENETKQVAKKVNDSVLQIFEEYKKEFGEEFTQAEVNSIIKRTLSRKRVEFLDKKIDALQLTKEELEMWQKNDAEEKNELNLKMFEDYLEQKDFRMAEYTINNYRKVWSLEQRKEMAKKIGEAYTINPYTDCVDTIHNVKKEAKKNGDVELLEKLKNE